ncbi:N-acetylneuraminate synthase family protein [Leptospira borgpetersenii]|uniref:NeuB family protein n=1 Tax=Leptospira borgpetersenii str. Brem 328 TaxID=1049780 RepID=A0ABC9SF49_LEPBO|nr:N-acetylneuraminate synthase family protein [Leptospira borgpetersenii]EMN13024.1 NeuB family protein [Leptospira borgpetersenii str. Brem 307]EMN16341.1 NeuB family protein [Leptospira borgpetersenii str. Brem 328]
MPQPIQLGNKIITGFFDPYVIAEIGVNHEGSIDIAKRLIDEAKDGGADGAKFQTYKAETLASKNSPSYWDRTQEPTASQFELFKKYDSFGWKEYEILAKHCQSVGIDFLSTPFDLEAVEHLASQMPFIKVASADITSVPLLRSIAKYSKPVILSTGSSTIPEIDFAMRELHANGANEIILLHCILNYPTKPENANLGMIQDLQRIFPHHWIGYSDHTPPDLEMKSLITATLFGSVVLEKHFTHDKTLPGNDHYHAMDKEDLKRFKRKLKEFESLIGSSEKAPLQSEELSRKNARRSIVLSKNLSKGSKIKEQDITFKRPAHGISPIFWDDVIGRVINRDLLEDHILNWEDLVQL